MKDGERGRNRTYNLLIKSQLLCQLSYAPTVGIWLVGQTKIIASDDCGDEALIQNDPAASTRVPRSGERSRAAIKPQILLTLRERQSNQQFLPLIGFAAEMNEASAHTLECEPKQLGSLANFRSQTA